MDLASGRVEKIHAIDREYFGEGITILGNKLYEITWKSGLAFVYDVDTFNVVQTFQYPTEGWGLTHDGEHLIMSDGSATLRFLDPATFKTQREITVHDGDEPVTKLNELEYHRGRDMVERLVRRPDRADLAGRRARARLDRPRRDLSALRARAATTC